MYTCSVYICTRAVCIVRVLCTVYTTTLQTGPAGTAACPEAGRAAAACRVSAAAFQPSAAACWPSAAAALHTGPAAAADEAAAVVVAGVAAVVDVEAANRTGGK